MAQPIALRGRRTSIENEPIAGESRPCLSQWPRGGCGAMAGPGPLPAWLRGSCPAVLSRLRGAVLVRPGFLSAAEEDTLSRELEPELRRRRYEYDHWDAVRRCGAGRGGTLGGEGPEDEGGARPRIGTQSKPLGAGPVWEL